MKQKMALLFFLAALALTACSSDPQWADPEAHEKTVQLNERYAPLMVGTWHYEKIGERHRYFERLTFKDDGTLTGYRKWQCRELVTIGGKEQYTDWKNVGQPTGWGDEEGPMNGTFTGTWHTGTRRVKAVRSETVCNWKQNTMKSVNIWLIHTLPHSTMPTRPRFVFKVIMPRMKTVG